MGHRIRIGNLLVLPAELVQRTGQISRKQPQLDVRAADLEAFGDDQKPILIDRPGR
jgi:hypothetical protein